MNIFKSLFYVWSGFFLFSPSGIAADTVTSFKDEQVEVKLLHPKSVGAFEEHWGIQFDLKKDWHIYWLNPGDSGASPKFQFSSAELTVGPVKWRSPERIPLSHLVNYGYKDEVIFPFLVQSTGASLNQMVIDLEWLVCKVECIPGFTQFKISLPLSQESDAKSVWSPNIKSKIEKSVLMLPQESNLNSFQIESAKLVDAKILEFELTGLRANDQVLDVFPSNGEYFSTQTPNIVKISDGQFKIELFLQEGVILQPEKLGFVHVVTNHQGQEKSFLKELPKEIGLSIAGPITDKRPYWIYLLFAFLGGIILNLMPCVFPVLSLKIFAFAKDRQSHLKDGIWYSVGVVATFTLLGLGLLLLKSLGSQVGWGFQLQHPIVVSLLIVLFFLMALNFFGFFEIGYSIMNVAADADHKSQKLKGSSFLTGVLAVFVAAPCTGPFMGSALGAASVLPAVPALMIFVTLGFGLAFPFLVLASSPKLLSYLPKPGAWMESLKQFLGFPLLLTSVWLIWVLNSLVSPDAGILVICLLVGIGFFIWLGKSPKPYTKIIALILSLMLVIAVFYQVDRMFYQSNLESGASTDANSGLWKPFDPMAVQQDLAAGRSVFIDFTAKWCITCQVNKKNVLETAEVQRLFESNQVSVYRADWTKYDPMITQALAKVGRNSVPVYLFYNKGSSNPLMLPQILTFNDINNLF